jgi:hypothetical protein
MNSKTTRVAVTGTLIAIASAVIIACHDSATPPITQASATASMVAMQLTPNRMAWVGEAHNRALGEVFARTDRGRGPSGNFCTRAVGPLAATPAFKAAQSREGYSHALMARSMKAGLATGPCTAWRESVRARKTTAIRPVAYWAQEEEYTVSSAVQAQLDAIVATATIAHSAAHYDTLLNAVVQAAATFPDTLDQAVILSSAAIASSSAHYWEVNYASELNAIIDATIGEIEGNPECASQLIDPQLSDLLNCIDGEIDLSSNASAVVHAAFFNPTSSSRRMHFAVAMQASDPLGALNADERACAERWEAGGGWRGLLKADAVGGIAGAITGAIVGKGWQAVGLGALGGGGLASASDTIYKGGIISMCRLLY